MLRSSRVSRCGPEALTHTAEAGAEWEKGDGGGPRRGNPSEPCTCTLSPQRSDADPALSSLPAQLKPTTACVLPRGPWRHGLGEPLGPQDLHAALLEAVQVQPQAPTSPR